MFTWGLLEALVARADVEPVAYAVTWRGRGELGQLAPRGVGLARSPVGARPLPWAWGLGVRGRRWLPVPCAGGGRGGTSRRSSGGRVTSTSSTAPTSLSRRRER